MSQNNSLYPKLRYFFSAYFHQDWKSMYNWNGNKPSLQIVVRDFRSNNPKATVSQAVQELEKLSALKLPEKDLRDIVTHQLGANIYAPGMGLSFQELLEVILASLKEN